MYSLLLALVLGLSPPAEGARIKDVARLDGQRDNPLIGQGLVVGLNRSGDSARNEATLQALSKRLQGLGFTVTTEDIKSRNVAAVMVTARMASSARPGHQIDVEVSSMGDATSLEGGILLITPLSAPNGDMYGWAQGPIVIGGYSASQDGSSARKNHPTVGRVPQGGTVERDNPNRLSLDNLHMVRWLVQDQDLTTATRMADAIDLALEGDWARAVDEGVVQVEVPPLFRGRVVELVSAVEALDVTVDAPARVVINERTGTVVMGADVRISPVAVAHGGLSIEVERSLEASQPMPFGQGDTVVMPESRIVVEEAGGELKVVDGPTIGDLVTALNNMGVGPRDLIQILLTIKAAGAMQAELEVL